MIGPKSNIGNILKKITYFEYAVSEFPPTSCLSFVFSLIFSSAYLLFRYMYVCIFSSSIMDELLRSVSKSGQIRTTPKMLWKLPRKRYNTQRSLYSIVIVVVYTEIWNEKSVKSSHIWLFDVSCSARNNFCE